MKTVIGRMAVALLGSASLMLGGVAGPAVADEADVVEVTAEEEAQSRAFLTEFGVSPEVQDRLLATTRAGGVALADSGLEAPLSVESFERDGSRYAVSTYSDGSIFVEEREIPIEVEEGEVAPMAITGCTISGGSGYTTYNRCKVHYRSHVFSYGFRATFTQIPGSKGTISWVGEKFQDYAIGHWRVRWSVSIRQASSSVSAGPAKARLLVEYNILPAAGQITRYLCLRVSSSSYSQANVNC